MSGADPTASEVKPHKYESYAGKNTWAGTKMKEHHHTHTHTHPQTHILLMHTAKNKSNFSRNHWENTIISPLSALFASPWRDKSEPNWLICGTREWRRVPAVLYTFSDALHVCFIILTTSLSVDRTFPDPHLAKAKDCGSRSDWQVSPRAERWENMLLNWHSSDDSLPLLANLLLLERVQSRSKCKSVLFFQEDSGSYSWCSV